MCSVLFDTGEVVFGLWFVLCSCRDPSDLWPSFSFCVVVAAFTLEVSGQEMGGDGFQTQKRTSWIPGQVRAERVLADAITIDGRKEWICKFCSETGVWTWRRCRRCYPNILAGLQGKYRQAVSAKTRSGHQDRRPRGVEKERGNMTRMRRSKSCERRLSSSGGSREWRRGRECKVSRRESGLEKDWNMEVDEES